MGTVKGWKPCGDRVAVVLFLTLDVPVVLDGTVDVEAWELEGAKASSGMSSAAPSRRGSKPFIGWSGVVSTRQCTSSLHGTSHSPGISVAAPPDDAGVRTLGDDCCVSSAISDGVAAMLKDEPASTAI